MRAIVKVQVPLSTNDHAARALVYAKAKENMVQQQLDHATKVALGSDAKAFFEAEYRHAQGKWTIGKRVKDRNW
jgi:hypothetical protein